MLILTTICSHRDKEMYRLKRLLAICIPRQYFWKAFFWDTFLAFAGALAITLLLYVFHLYPRIHSISLVYLVVVLALASTRGLYPAVLASLVAFLSFDFFLVPPLYTFTVASAEEWLALFVFLCAAIVTGQLAAALRLRAEQARERERETRILYELLRDSHKEEDLDHQLIVLARTVVEVFAPRGVRDCMILLPDETGKLTLRVSTSQERASQRMSADELSAAEIGRASCRE